MTYYQQTVAEREANIAHYEAVQEVRAAEENRTMARNEYFKINDEVVKLLDELDNDELRLAVHRLVGAARAEVTADWAVDAAMKNRQARAWAVRCITETLTPSDFQR
jgi:EAL domain-containing protein (putative c-di-GMP-specific phosphodiesterase class I)